MQNIFLRNTNLPVVSSKVILFLLCVSFKAHAQIENIFFKTFNDTIEYRIAGEPNQNIIQKYKIYKIEEKEIGYNKKGRKRLYLFSKNKSTISLYNDIGKITYFNSGFEQTFSYDSAEQLIGTCITNSDKKEGNRCIEIESYIDSLRYIEKVNDRIKEIKTLRVKDTLGNKNYNIKGIYYTNYWNPSIPEYLTDIWKYESGFIKSRHDSGYCFYIYDVFKEDDFRVSDTVNKYVTYNIDSTVIKEICKSDYTLDYSILYFLRDNGICSYPSVETNLKNNFQIINRWNMPGIFKIVYDNFGRIDSVINVTWPVHLRKRSYSKYFYQVNTPLVSVIENYYEEKLQYKQLFKYYFREQGIK